MRFLLPLAMASTFIASSLPVQATPDAHDLGGPMAVYAHTPPADLPVPDRTIELEAGPSPLSLPGARSSGSMGVSLFTLSDNGVQALPSISQARALLATSVLSPDPETVTLTVPTSFAQAVDKAPVKEQVAPNNVTVISYRGEEMVNLSRASEPFTINFLAPIGPLEGVVLIRRQEQGNPILERIDLTDLRRVSFSADRRSITLNHSIRVDRNVVYQADFGNVSGPIPNNSTPFLFTITDGGTMASVAAPAAVAAVTAPAAAGVGTILVVLAVAAGVGIGIAAATGAFSGGTNPSSK